MSLDLRSAVPLRLEKDVTAAGTAERLSATERAVRAVTIRAKSDNTDLVAIGDADVDAVTLNSVWLDPGDVLVLGPTDLRNWWIDAATNGDGVFLLGEDV